MTTILVVVFVIFSILFAFILVPKLTTDIAINEGFDRNKWIFYSISLNVIALIWLYSVLNPGKNKEKKYVLVLILVYIGIFCGAYAIDKYTHF
jgi:uncharacterized BrkB/YihY/UPF0761 family membrane protein